MTTKVNLESNSSPRLDVTGYYSKRSDLELSGSSNGLLQLASLLASEPIHSEVSLLIPKDLSPDPYDGFLRVLQIDKNNDQVLIRREEDVLWISGSLPRLQILAENIKNLAAQTSETSDHIHEEYYPGHYFLSSSSHPLVITRTSG